MKVLLSLLFSFLVFYFDIVFYAFDAFFDKDVLVVFGVGFVSGNDIFFDGF